MMENRSLFDRDLNSNELANKTISGGLSTLLFQFLILALHFVALAILSRILPVEDFGLIAMATAFTNLAHLFSNFGLANATIQRAKINNEEVSSLFWLNAIIGVLIVVVLFFMAYPLSNFYGETDLLHVVQVSSLCFLFSSLTIQHDALLKRNLMLFELNLVSVFATISSMIIGVSLALLGFSYWAIVAMSISSICLLYTSPSPRDVEESRMPSSA